MASNGKKPCKGEEGYDWFQALMKEAQDEWEEMQLETWKYNLLLYPSSQNTRKSAAQTTEDIEAEIAALRKDKKVSTITTLQKVKLPVDSPPKSPQKMAIEMNPGDPQKDEAVSPTATEPLEVMEVSFDSPLTEHSFNYFRGLWSED